MPRNAGTGVYARVVNSFSQPVLGTLIDPTDADAYFDDLDVGLNPPKLAGPLTIVGALTATSIGGLTSLGIRDTSAAFDLKFVATSSPVLTADRTITWNIENVSETIALNGSLNFGSNFTTSGSFPLTLTQTASTNVTLPISGTLVAQGGPLGTPSSGVATNLTGLPLSTGITGAGTGILAALAVNVGTAGAPVINGGALGSPSSAGTIPAFTLGGTIAGGGNQLNNVIIGTATPLAGTFTTLTANTSVSSPIHTSSGTYTFQSNGSTFAGQITTGQQWEFGANAAPAAGPTLTLNQNSATPVATFVGSPALQIVTANATIGGIVSDVYGAQNFWAARHASGTQASKTASAAATTTHTFGSQTWDGSAYATNGAIDFSTVSLQSGTDHSSIISFRTVPVGSTTMTVAMSINSSGGVGVGTATDPGIGNILANKMVGTGAVAVASLPAAAAGNKGFRYFVTDANATTFWTIVAGGGANNVPVTSDGTNWRIG